MTVPMQHVEEPDGPVPAPELATTLDLELLTPITFGKETITTIHLEEPTMAQVKAMQKGTTMAEQSAILIALNAKLLPAIVDKMRYRDMQRCDDFFGRFLGGSTPGS